MFPCEICEIFKNSFFHRIPPVAASVYSYVHIQGVRENSEHIISFKMFSAFFAKTPTAPIKYWLCVCVCLRANHLDVVRSGVKVDQGLP